MLKLSSRFYYLNQTNCFCSYFFFYNRKNIEQVGFKSQDISDSNKLSFIANQKIEYNQGKYLIYKYKNSLLSKLKGYSHFLAILSGINYLLWTKPYIAVFPAATPILWILDILTLYLMTKKYKKNQNVVSQIHLLEGGSSTRIFYANSSRRKLFGQPLSQTYYNSLFVNPDQKIDQIVALNLNPFPKQLSDFEKKTFGNLWTKYFSNGDNFLLIPKQYQFMKKQILMQVFKGKIVKSL